MTCDLNHSEDQRQILDAAQTMLETGFPVPRAFEDDHGRIGEIAEFGGFALALDENLGGAGFSVVEEALLHVRLGRHLVSTRALATPLAARVAGQTDQADLAGRIAAGETSVCAAIPARDELRLADAQAADLALVFSDRRLELVTLEGLAPTPQTGLGHGLRLASLPAAEPARLAASDNTALADTADLLVSAQLLGVAEATRDLAVSYAGVRRQFGKPIGAFQAIKHHCANMAIGAEMLSAQIDMAAIALRDGRDDATFQIAAARMLAARIALDNVRLCVQIHGGIGFSAEAAPHLYLKQAHLLRLLGAGADLLEQASPMAPHRPR